MSRPILGPNAVEVVRRHDLGDEIERKGQGSENSAESASYGGPMPWSLPPRALLLQVLSSIWAHARAGRTLLPEQQAEARAASTYATEVAQRVATVAFQSAGGRCFRDAYAAGQHAFVSQSSYRALGSSSSANRTLIRCYSARAGFVTSTRTIRSSTAATSCSKSAGTWSRCFKP
jgi:hypothetical protein